MSDGFHTLRVTEIAQETADALVLTLQAPAAAMEAFRFAPGQYLTLRAEIDGEDVRRNYSICSAAHSPALRVAIKKIEGGKFSTWVWKALAAGGSIEAMAPRGHFTWAFEAGGQRHYLAFAAGSGITPILSLLKTGLAIEPGSQFTLLYGNRTSDTIMFLEALAELKDRYLGRMQVLHFLSAEQDEIELFNGRLDGARIADVLANVIPPGSIDVAFICGPDKMMEASEAAMLSAGVTRDRVLVELFTPGGLPELATQAVVDARMKAQGLTMAITIDGRSRAVVFDGDKGSILENARAAGLPAPFACKAGVCATCRAKLVAGRVQMIKNYGLTAGEIEQGYILTCQSTPVGEGVVVSYDE